MVEGRRLKKGKKVFAHDFIMDSHHWRNTYFDRHLLWLSQRAWDEKRQGYWVEALERNMTMIMNAGHRVLTMAVCLHVLNKETLKLLKDLQDTFKLKNNEE